MTVPSPLLAAQVLVSLTLLVSGVAKLGDRTATADAMRSLRLPAVRLHPLGAAVLPVAEIALALLAWVPAVPVQVAVAVVTLLLMLTYLAIIARALRLPEPVTCSCFGTLGSPTVSRATLGRNALLTVLAALALVGASAGLPARAILEAPGALAAWALALTTAVVLAALTLGPRPADPVAASAPGGAPHDAADDEGDEEELDYLRTPIPHLVLRRHDGTLEPLRALAHDRAVLLLWLTPGCGPCERVLDRLGTWREALAPLVAVHVVTRGDVTALDPAALERVGPEPVEDIRGTLAAALGALGTPSTVLLGADGMLAGGPVAGASDVIDLVEEIVVQLREAVVSEG